MNDLHCACVTVLRQTVLQDQVILLSLLLLISGLLGVLVGILFARLCKLAERKATTVDPSDSASPSKTSVPRMSLLVVGVLVPVILVVVVMVVLVVDWW